MDTILPDPTTLALIMLRDDHDHITAIVRPTTDESLCPGCHLSARRVHSHYQRTLLDLPWHGVTMYLVLRVRRFFCDAPDCARRIFTERLPQVVAPYARRTQRVDEWLTSVGLALGGEAGARLIQQLGLSRSPDTVLRHVRRIPQHGEAAPQIVGIDDFAFRRGQTYGTIIVDLLRHQVIDLLPDRETATVVAWLRAHPQITVVSRDRAQGYADAIRQGAPGALQVADRFHLIQNLGQALDRFLERHGRQLQEANRSDAPAPEPQPLPSQRQSHLARQATQERREQRHHAIHKCLAQGYSLRETARALHLSRETVARYAQQGVPTPSRPHRPTMFDTFAAYLRQRWEEGEQNAAQLYREIQAQGYRGAASYVRGYVQHWRVRPRKRGRGSRCDLPTPLPPRPPRSFSARQTRWFLLQPELAKGEAQTYVERLGQAMPLLPLLQDLVQWFLHLVREQRPDELATWMREAKASGIKELARFAAGLERDHEAVVAALSLPWSQGQVEGSVNRLKLIKRSGYGRMKFDLLRQRVLLSKAS